MVINYKNEEFLSRKGLYFIKMGVILYILSYWLINYYNLRWNDMVKDIMVLVNWWNDIILVVIDVFVEIGYYCVMIV